MTISVPYEDSASISTSEYSLPNDSTSLTSITDDGIYQIFIDFNAMVAGDQYEVKVYEKVQSGGSQFVVYHAYVTGLDGGMDGGVLVLPSLVLVNGWDVTVKRLAGSDRTIGWSIRKVA